ncbi:coiled-coil domain-containing protein 18 [Clupea harengus]|uniref:Coiled-coil domain-containing protein 18 n=1 Tax=Clupea harengus TaxID=7950 RepID=A0A8M1K5M7_CLUHA|nr:coiled-coil domain-containing protein 18 [Clupea harengus]
MTTRTRLTKSRLQIPTKEGLVYYEERDSKVGDGVGCPGQSTAKCTYCSAQQRSGRTLEQELKTLRAEIAIKSRQAKRAELQRNQALSNAERLSVTLKNYKDEVGEKLTKVMKSESRLKQTLIVCDGERMELDKRCVALEREKDESHQTIRRLKERCERAEAQNTECSLLQSQVQGAEHDMKMELNQQQEEVQNLKKEQQDLNQLIAFQQQRLAEQQQEIQQKVSELHSLEEILQRLHLREGTEGVFCVNPCLLTSAPHATNNDQVNLQTGQCYQQLLSVLQSSNQERSQQAVQQRELQAQLQSAQAQLSSMETTLGQRAAHYQSLYAELLDKASHTAALEKELKKTKSCLVILQEQLLEKSSAYSQAARRNCQLEQELLDQISVLDKKQREFQQALDNIQEVRSEKMKKHTDMMEVLQLSLDQKQSEMKVLEQTICLRDRQREEAQHAASLLQVSLDRLTEGSKVETKRNEEALQHCKERAAESAAKVKSLEAALRSCQEELVHCHQMIQEANQECVRQLQLKSNEVAALQKEVDQEQRERLREEEEARRQAGELTRKERELKEASHQAAHLSHSITELSAEMVRCRGELSAMELELLHLRKDSSSKASQLCQMEEEIQQTHGLLKKKSETVVMLEEKLQRRELNECDSVQRTEALEQQLQVMRAEFANTLQHLEELRTVFQHTHLTSQQQQADMEKLSAALRESQVELEKRNHDVFNMDAALKEHQDELQQRAQLLGQLDVLIREHNMEMEMKVLQLQEALEKTGASLKDRNEEVIPSRTADSSFLH